MSTPRPLRFSKMHGAGNDFMVIDLRGGEPAPSAAMVRALGDRHFGVGFDQLLGIDDSQVPGCAARYRIWNGDGSLAQQCGNGARCVAAWLRRDGAAVGTRFRLDSPAGVIEVDCLPDGGYALGMGRPAFEPAQLPFLAAADLPMHALPLEDGLLRFGVVSMGNPHAVIEVDSVDAAPVLRLGPALQARAEFPEGVNVGFAQVLARDRIRLRVFERGAGETLACGSGACAAVAVLVRQGRVDRAVQVELPGGTLAIRWPSDADPITMAGPATFVFEGEFAVTTP
ncbi:diaminopimelate epimerase [Arenimonas alkanexedens]